MEDLYLIHHGIKGQKWGVRRYQNEDGTLTAAGKKRLSKQARKDAKEYARAKMYYGEGAGNRRKLIKASVEEKSKDAYYKSEFDRYLNEQNMDEHAKKAVQERHAADAKKRAGEAARGVYHTIKKDGASVASWVGTGMAVVGGLWTIAKITGYDQTIINEGKRVINNMRNR